MLQFVCLYFFLLPLMAADSSTQFTRGVGQYPGDPRDFAGPTFRIDNDTYRNLALHRPAWHSSAYDYNLTASNLTDGIRETVMPRWMAVTTSNGVLQKNERDWLNDGNWVSSIDFKGPKGAWVQYELAGGDGPLAVDRIQVLARVLSNGQPENWTATLSGSDDGQSWKELGRTSGMSRSGGDIQPVITLKEAAKHRFYRVSFEDPRASGWQIGEISFHNAGQPVRVGGPYRFSSAWMPAGTQKEWAMVDLGADCTVDRIALHWVKRPDNPASLQISGDGKNWNTLQVTGSGSGLAEERKLASAMKARYVRVGFSGSAALSEFEVFGRGGPVPVPKPAATMDGGKLQLTGGNWKVQRDSQVTQAGMELARPGFRDESWVPATVPGTVLTSYLNAGALPDPNYADNQLMISDSFFYADFWYRNEFTVPTQPAGRRIWLNFDGINWKAEVFLNGSRLGRIEGGFSRARFDITTLAKQGTVNALAVRTEKNASPGSVKEKTYQNPDKNGGVLGADNPTYHASIGWDWIPTIRGRDSGIWNDVWISTSGEITLGDPQLTTALPLPDTSRADVTIAIDARNHSTSAVSGVIHCRLGTIAFDQPVTLAAGETKTITFNPASHPALRIANPKLWWPAGYGEPTLHQTELRFETAGNAVSDSKTFQAGLRQLTFSEEGGTFRMWVNGRRFVGRGGNWGFPESMLRYRGREYEAAIRYHRDMNFTMIRNWVGQVGDDELYEACDRHGILIMQDFWLANPWDGPDPDDDAMFMANAKDMIARIRSHPSVGFYCGRNEGYPPAQLDRALRQAVASMHPGMHFVSSSADDVISGHGPYRAMPHQYYFTERATKKMHSELGMPNIVTMDSLRMMMPESAMWPQGAMWGLHDFCLNGAQGGASYLERINKSYGGADNIQDWVSLAQFVNYEGYRAMFEAQSKYRMGLLIWMSHPTWPSFVWQTYDYYFEPSAAYFGSKKASEPLHIQWNPATEDIEVVNYSGGNATGLTAKLELLSMDGKVVSTKSATLDSPEDSTKIVQRMEYPAGITAVHFLRLTLSREGNVVSENFYWRGSEQGNYRALRTLPAVEVTSSTQVVRKGESHVLSTELRNIGTAPALMVRIKALREKSGDRILPALYSDNYVALMPGEARTITTTLENRDTRGEAPRVLVEGFNLKADSK